MGIQNPLSWAACFIAFVATKVDSAETRELVAYGNVIISLAQKQSGSLGWATYDAIFQQQVATELT